MNNVLMKDRKVLQGFSPFATVILLLLLSHVVNAEALKKASLSTTSIIEKTIGCTDCLNYKIIGMCFFLDCGWDGCGVQSSVKVEHFIPDLIVSAYTSNSAWGDTDGWNNAKHAAMTTAGSHHKLESNLDFKHVDVITNPALLAINELGKQPLFCKSQHSKPLIPLFLSHNDPFWMQSTMEGVLATGQVMPNSTNRIYGKNVPGFLKPYWAGVYPRCGWGNHPYDPINAAVAAHRVSEIVTRKNQPHVYVPVSGSCDNRCWKPSSVVANNGTYNRFQMLYPKAEDDAKPIGGDVNWVNKKQTAHEAYTWALWRKYKCCRKRGDFIDDVEW